MESKSQFSQTPPRTDRFEDEETSSLSDYDSEWTQVSGTEDDSDYLPLTAASNRPLSRADTIDGSNDGDMWEGFVEGLHRSSSQGSDQTRPLDFDATDEALPATDNLEPSTGSQDPVDESTNDAPDSSFTGTVRASRLRSASSSVHASMTESQSKLRLSFPDPLSSREHLDTGSTDQDVSPPPSSVEEHCENVSTEDMSPSCAEAPMMHFDLDTADEISLPTLSIPDSATYALTLFLYGSTASSKWQIAERIAKYILQLDKEAVSIVEDGSCRTYYFDCANSNNRESNERGFVVRVFDRTSNFSEESSNADNCPPSIAILLLPSSLPALLPRHKFYLPLISPSSLDFGSTAPVISSTFSEHVTTDSAYYTWRKLDLPKENVIVLDRQRPQTILDASALESIDATSWARALSIVFAKANEEQGTSRIHQGVKLLAKKWYTLAFFAATLVAVTAGGVQVLKGSTSAPAAANVTPKATLVDATRLDTASTLTTFVVSANHLALTTHSPSPPRSLATIIVQTTDRGMSKPLDRSPGSLKMIDVPSAATVSPVVSAGLSTQSNCHSRARSWIDKVNLSLGEYIPRDLIVRPVDLLGAASKGLLPVQKPSGPLTSLSLRAVQNSLTVVSSKSKVLKETAEKDMLVIHEAIDELLRALGRQMNIAVEEMKDAKTVAQSGFSFRSARAKQNARRLRHAGEQFIKATGDNLRSRGEDVMKIASQSRRSRRRRDKRRGNVPGEVPNDQCTQKDKSQACAK